MGRNMLKQFRIRNLSRNPFRRYAPKPFVQVSFEGNDLTTSIGATGQSTLGQLPCQYGWLGCRTQDDARAIVADKFIQRPKTRPEKVDWEGLSFIQNDDRMGKVVQFAAGRCPVGMK